MQGKKRKMKGLKNLTMINKKKKERDEFEKSVKFEREEKIKYLKSE